MPLTVVLLMLGAPVLWIGYFLVLYAYVALGCALRWPQPVILAGTVALGMVALLAEVWIARASLGWRDEAAFTAQVALVLAVLAAVATLWVTVATLITPFCAP